MVPQSVHRSPSIQQAISSATNTIHAHAEPNDGPRALLASLSTRLAGPKLPMLRPLSIPRIIALYNDPSDFY